jgi:tRNA nucleotidyltransferase (CCA-adding enzyme)
MEWFASRTHELGIEHAPPEPLLKGRHLLSLGLKPGPAVGNILKVIYEKQLDGDITTLEEALAEATLSLRRPQ